MIRKSKKIIVRILLRICKKLIPAKVPIQMWTGNYPSWQEVSALCTGYDTAEILEKCKNAALKVSKGEAAYERDSVLFFKEKYNWPLIAGLQKAALENDGHLCVLDFGGSLGSCYFQNRKFLTSVKSLTWCIVEQKHFVECGRTYFENDTLKYYDSLEMVMQHHQPNVLLASGVMHCMEKPYEWVEKFLALKIPYIIIDRTGFIEGDRAVITRQDIPESIYKASYPSWFLNQEFFINAWTNYDTLAEFDNDSDIPFLLNGNQRVYWSGYILRHRG